jgi:DNA-binding beta-propeller fold protein YncE
MTHMARLTLGLALWLAALLAGAAGARQAGGTPVALVTAETEDALLAVSLPDGRVRGRVALPADPENVAATQKVAVAVSSRGRAVTLLAPRTLRVTRTLHGFVDPHLVAIAPGGQWAYVTDDGAGRLDVVSLQQKRVVARLEVGAGAHHLTVSPNGRRVWVALGEHARTLVIVDVSRPAHPRVISRFDPAFSAHDVAFAPDGKRVWVTSSSGTSVYVLDARSGRRVFSFFGGRAPQHVAFGQFPRLGYVTSGYGGRIEAVDPHSGRVLRARRVPYGSFNVATIGGVVATSSLMRGTVTELDSKLRIWRSVKVAAATRGLAMVVRG